MADHSDDDRGKRGYHPAPPFDEGEIDPGVTPPQAVDEHPAEGIENQHDLEADILPVDIIDETSEHTISPTERSEGGTR